MKPYVMIMKMEGYKAQIYSQNQLAYSAPESKGYMMKTFIPEKVIHLYLIQMHFGKNFKFHRNLDLRDFSLNFFPKY